jgi:UMF1 family MFS transporter
MIQSRRATWSWCFYDWANSSFTTLVVTFIYATYFTQAFAENEARGTALWSRGIVVSSILIALLSPILGSFADRGGTRRAFLITSTLICVGATTLLAFLTPDLPFAVWLALGTFVVGNVAFEVGMVFYNAFLPSVSTPATLGRISGRGWGLGYIGGLLCLVVALFGFVGLGDAPPWIPLARDAGLHVRATNLLVAGWFLLFSLPMLLWVRDPPLAAALVRKASVRGAYDDLSATFGRLLHFPQVFRFLLARLVYNDGLVTIFAFGGIYAAGTFGMEFSEVIVFGIALNLAAGIGAWVFGFVDDRLGGKNTVQISLFALLTAALLAVLAPTKTLFWVAGIMVGIFAGPNQAASRSVMARIVPAQHENEFFGFFAFSGKATAFLGPLLLGLASDAFGQRAGVSTVMIFFVLGIVLLARVNEQEGARQADDADAAAAA